MYGSGIGSTRGGRRLGGGALAAGAVTLLMVGAAGGAAADRAFVRQAGGEVATATAPSAPPPAAAPVSPAPAKLTPPTHKPPEARALSGAFAATAKAVRPSVVRIDVEHGAPRVAQGPRGGNRQIPPELAPFFERFFRDGDGEGGGMPPGLTPQPGRGTGSGVIIDTQGHVVTNRHVIQGATKVTVALHDGQEVSAKVVGKDERTDVAVVKLDRVPPGLVAARLGDSDRIEVGEWVLAVGTPLGIEQTVTAGIVSGKGRNARMGAADRVRGYLQTDAKINPGNSGGPLVDLDGQVVGINTFINVGPGGAYGFAIPVNDVKRVSQALIKDGRIRYPYLGVLVGDVTKLEPDDKEKITRNAPAQAAAVTQVTPGGPAAQAGLRPWDLIVRIDNQDIKTADDVIGYVSSRPIGSKVNVKVIRADGKTDTVSVVLGELPSSDQMVAAAGASGGKVGLALQSLNPDLAGRLGIPGNIKGAVIADVAGGSPAERAGLQPGEVIVEINRRPINSAEEAVAALAQPIPAASGHLLRVRGPSGARFVPVKPE
jgi:serine protease Do